MYQKIKEVSKSKKIPISKIEKDLGFGQGCICRWGKSVCPSFDKVGKVAEYLDIPITDLIKNKES